MDTTQMYEIILLALCVWREARNQPKIAQEGVAWTVRNRVSSPGWWGNSYVSCILKPFQYSSFDPHDSNAIKLPGEPDLIWEQCLDVAQDVWQGISKDPTSGCQNYFDASLDLHPPAWATNGSFAFIVDLGQLHFYKRNSS